MRAPKLPHAQSDGRAVAILEIGLHFALSTGVAVVSSKRHRSRNVALTAKPGTPE